MRRYRLQLPITYVLRQKQGLEGQLAAVAAGNQRHQPCGGASEVQEHRVGCSAGWRDACAGWNLVCGGGCGYGAV